MMFAATKLAVERSFQIDELAMSEQIVLTEIAPTLKHKGLDINTVPAAKERVVQIARKQWTQIRQVHA